MRKDRYALKVHAMVAPEVPGSEALAARLLAPLAEVPVAKREHPKADGAPGNVSEQPATPAAPPALRPTGTG